MNIMKFLPYYSKKYGKNPKLFRNKIEKGEPEMGHNKNYPTKRSKNEIDSSILNDYANQTKKSKRADDIEIQMVASLLFKLMI